MSADDPAPTGVHWARLGESTFAAGIWLLFQVHRLLGRTVFRLCMWPVVFLHWALRPGLRAHSRQYLERLQQATGALGRPVHGLDTLRHIGQFAETMLDKLLAVSGGYPSARVEVVGHEALGERIRAGGGGVLVTAHLGCLELCRVMARRVSPVRLTILVHTAHAERFNAILRRLDPEQAGSVELIEVRTINPATAALLDARVRAGGWLVIAGDRVPVQSSQVVRLPFLGHDAAFPVGPYVLAALLKCPLWWMGCVHGGRGYRIHFRPLAEQLQLPRGDRQTGLRQYAGVYVAALTELLVASPYDWFNFYAFWDQG